MLNNSNQIGILFYSRNCRACQQLINMMSSENMLPYFELFCIDNNNVIPPQITTVPTMIIYNIKKMLVAEETFKWLQQFKYIRQQMTCNNVNKNEINTSSKKLELNKESKIHDNKWNYFKIGSNNISDQYAYVVKDGTPLENRFVNINEQNRMIFTAPESYKIDKNEQMKKMSDLEIKRNNEDIQLYQFQKDQHINIILNENN